MDKSEKISAKAHRALFLNTLAFTICFGAWMLNGVLVTYLVDNQVFDWSPVEIGWLMGIPVLTGAIFRLPAGILTDKFGGKYVYGILLFICAIPMYFLSYAHSFLAFAIASFGFGFAGVSFAIGIAFTSVWYPARWQGRALGIFGAGNAGAALTTLFAPTLLNTLTDNGTNLEEWRTLPQIYAGVLALMGVIFLLFTINKKPETNNKTLTELLAPLKKTQTWRFGLYYFLAFGCFVAFSQWLVPYFVNAYYLPLVTAGFLAAMFSFPSGVIRALGGWMSDKLGARTVMYWVLGLSASISLLLIVPKMDIYSPGKGIMAKRAGIVTAINPEAITVDDIQYGLVTKEGKFEEADDRVLIWPRKEIWQEPMVKLNQHVTKKQLLAKGVTRIYFQANVWVFAVLVIMIGSVWGVGSAAVYKYIPNFFPNEVGVVGGMVGVLGGLGGFFCPIIFGYLLEGTGLWTSCWIFMLLLSLACLIWMINAIRKKMNAEVPKHILEYH